MNILIIDDSKLMRVFLGGVVQQLRGDSMEAEDGRNALQILEQKSDFDVALVDWEMPNMNGLEFVKTVRADPQWRELKLMMVTSQNSMEHVAEALAAGATDFLMKPVTRQSLEEKLRLLGVIL
jgi:two-component system chemotaxis response regulator CheY